MESYKNKHKGRNKWQEKENLENIDFKIMPEEHKLRKLSQCKKNGFIKSFFFVMCSIKAE